MHHRRIPEHTSDVPREEQDVPREEQIKARLRELTEDTRRVREELEQLIHYERDRTRSFSQDRPYQLRMPPRPPTAR